MKATVVIPYYHTDLTESEQISWKQAVRIFKEETIILVIPQGMDCTACPKAENIYYRTIPKEWLESVASYNQMMLKKEFYEIFLEFDYILIYQLDAFVFRNELSAFCKLGFDYIGAPWLTGVLHYRDIDHAVWYVGNGGFSLRKVQSFIKILDGINSYQLNLPEDVFFAMQADRGFHIAPKETALQFSFDAEVRKCYEANDFRIPFGCHAWEERDLEFWRPYLEREGYRIPSDWIGDGDIVRPMGDARYMDLDVEFMRRSVKHFLKCEKIERKIVIWGAGNLGRQCGFLLNRAGMDFAYVDKSLEKRGSHCWGRLISTPGEMLTDPKAEMCIVAVGKKDMEEISEKLEKRGFESERDFFFFKDWQTELKSGIEKNT